MKTETAKDKRASKKKKDMNNGQNTTYRVSLSYKVNASTICTEDGKSQCSE